MKKKATCVDIEKIVKVLKEHELKPNKYGLITITIPLDTYTSSPDSESPFYRDSVGTEELHEAN